MGDHQGGLARHGVAGRQDGLGHPGGRGGVQAGRGLVVEQDGGGLDQGAGDGGPLAQPPRERLRPRGQVAGSQAHGGGGGLDPGLELRGRQIARREGQVLGHGAIVEEGGVLEDHPHDRGAVHGAGVGGLEAEQQIQQHRLAAARRPHHHHHLARGQLQIHAIQDEAAAEALADLIEAGGLAQAGSGGSGA
ncbi:MAG: hypothetical protein R3F43_15340 [bacterium]